MKHYLVSLVLLFSIYNFADAQTDSVTNEPVFFLDSVRVRSDILYTYDPNDLAAISVFKDSTAIKILGNEGKNGVIYITTKKYAKEKYWKYFNSKSPEYSKAVPSIDNESNVVYILNQEVLTGDFIGTLFYIDNDSFIDLKVLTKKQLKKEFRIKDKDWGILIRTKT